MKKLVLLTLDERNAIDALTQEVPQEEQKEEKDFYCLFVRLSRFVTLKYALL